MTEFSDHLQDVFRDFGDISCRKMFGGLGVFYQGLMIGLVADDVLYLKTDPQSQHFFSEEGLPQFSYQKGEKTILMSYFQAPETIYDDSAEAELWAKRAFTAADRAARKKRKITRIKI